MESQGEPDKRGVISGEWPTFDLRANWDIPKEWGEMSEFQAFPILRKRVDADYFVPDSSSSSRDLVFSLGLKYATNLEKQEEIACMYASAMSAFAPELEDEFLSSMKNLNIHPQRILLPSEANARRIVLNDHEKYGPDETLVLFGTGLYIIFKKITMIEDVHVYNRLVTNSINALGSKLGMSDGVLTRLKFPLTIEKARAVRRAFGLYKELKAKIIRYLISARKQEGNLSKVASHMCEILSWSEITAFASIKDMLHASNSPVLQDLHIQGEVRAFYYAMKKINESEHPQFYPYFCSGMQDMYLERSNFPVLALVAEALRLDDVQASSSGVIFAKRKARSTLEIRLVSLHRSYVNYVRLSKINKPTSNVS